MTKPEFTNLLRASGYTVVFDNYGTPLAVTTREALGKTAEDIEAIARTAKYDGSRGCTCRTEEYT